ncbi:sigma-70 family RNA polymerase sigma factor [Micromonospora lupini]|uniref:sigma-70 family RNA polymerase sigma factor n=1 Tax=Micromonospora lupini TaxID=285679 RepID=UPI0031E1F758
MNNNAVPSPVSDESHDAWMRDLHGTHADPLRRYLIRLTLGEPHLAEDLLQETMLRAWRHRAHLPTDHEGLRRWLFTVAKRIAIDALRAKQARPTEIGTADVSLLSAASSAMDDVVSAVQTVRQAMPKLTPAHRAVLIELYLLGRSVEEAAVQLGIPEGTVKSRAHYALRSLRDVIGPIDE